MNFVHLEFLKAVTIRMAEDGAQVSIINESWLVAGTPHSLAGDHT